MLVDVSGNVPSLSASPVIYAEPEPSTAIALMLVSRPLDS